MLTKLLKLASTCLAVWMLNKLFNQRHGVNTILTRFVWDAATLLCIACQQQKAPPMPNSQDVKLLPDNTQDYTQSFLIRVVNKFDSDPTCAEFMSEDGDGGFIGAIHRMAREIERLRAMNTPTPRCDAQGRLLSLPLLGTQHFFLTTEGVEMNRTTDTICDRNMLEAGQLFISQPAAEAELTRLKCLQRLRGMEGFICSGSFSVWVEPHIIALSGFDTLSTATAAEATITPEERDAFLYREPMVV